MRLRLIVLTFVLCLSFVGCHGPSVPPEVDQVKLQESTLWRAGALIYAPVEYKNYQATYQVARGKFLDQKIKFAWFRKYKNVKAEFKKVIAEGDQVLTLIEERKGRQGKTIIDRYHNLEICLLNLRRLTEKINEGRYARPDLIKAELLLAEVKLDFTKGRYTQALQTLPLIDPYVEKVQAVLNDILGRYIDKDQLNLWDRWVKETLTQSRMTGSIAVIVNKIDREMTVYRAGKPLKTYEVGLGSNGMNHKRHAGDEATPEGKYFITKKVYPSRYYKALLINYPNEEDKRKFQQAKKKGLISSRVGIGGLVEIHGGGKAFMTRGCVSVEDNEMDEIFKLADVGTPVTIVGSMGYPHELSTLKDSSHDQK